MVEKIQRDVRITTIYEGTSEIMEMTIARDRWQEHLKTRGEHYHDAARELEALHARTRPSAPTSPRSRSTRWPSCWRRCRVDRLTRNQHVLLRLGELVAQAEGAAALARRAARPRTGRSPRRPTGASTPTRSAAMSRVFAREAALPGRAEGDPLGRRAPTAASVGELSAAARAAGRPRAQAGLLADMDAVADALYARAACRRGSR